MKVKMKKEEKKKGGRNKRKNEERKQEKKKEMAFFVVQPGSVVHWKTTEGLTPATVQHAITKLRFIINKNR